jgi:hypothetical protein
MDLDWDLAEENLAREEAMLWRCEHEVRLRCDGLTPLEARELRKCSMWADSVQCRNDAEKVQNFFGLSARGTAACRRLLKYAMEKEPCQPGKVVDFKNVQFTLAKHLLLADRRHRLIKEDLPSSIMPCKCFSATYAMPAGCLHVKQPLWKAGTMRATLCPTCSKCLRCDKLLTFCCLIHVSLMWSL